MIAMQNHKEANEWQNNQKSLSKKQENGSEVFHFKVVGSGRASIFKLK